MSLLPQTTSNTISASSSSLSLSNKGSGQACAACKYQRRKCAPDCILAPYFPHDSQRQFLNAHKLYGVSNITKIIKSLDSPAAKDVAMKSIIIQSDARAADPVGGCYRIIRDLERQIDYTTAQLNLVLQHLAIFRAASSTTTTTFYDDQNNPSDQFLHPQVIDHPELQAQYVDLQDDVSSWVVQDSVMDVKPAIGVVNGDQDLHVEPHHHHHQRDDEAMLRTVVNDNVMLKEEHQQDNHYTIQQNEAEEDDDNDDLRDGATLFTLTNCTS